MSLTTVKKHADFVLKTPILRQIMLPISKAYVKFSGYRNMGLRQDDLLMEETPTAQTALNRLSSEESYARSYRIITAHQLSLTQSVLSNEKAVQPEEDIPYLWPLILEAEAAAKEKDDLDNIVIKKH